MFLDKSFMLIHSIRMALLDQERYNNKLKKIKEELPETELFEKIKIQIGDNFYKEIRGHFLESWMCSVVRYIIKNNGYTNNIDNTSLRTSFWNVHVAKNVC